MERQCNLMLHQFPNAVDDYHVIYIEVFLLLFTSLYFVFTLVFACAFSLFILFLIFTCSIPDLST